MTSPGRYPLRSRTSSAWRLFSMVCSFTFIRPRLPLRASSRSFSFCSASAMRRLISACRRALFANSSSAAARCCASAVCASCASIVDENIAPPALQRPSVREQQARPLRGHSDLWDPPRPKRRLPRRCFSNGWRNKRKKGEGKGRRRREEGVFRRNGTNIAHSYDAPRAHSSRA